MYASNVTFGERYVIDYDQLKNNNFPTDLKLDTEVSKEDSKKGSQTITLGRSLAESYIRNSAGFHSSLSRQTPNQSNITNEHHNFWTTVSVNLGEGKIDETATKYHIKLTNGFDGTGTILKDAEIISLEGEDDAKRVKVNDPVLYSLLKQDDSQGTKTYLAISSGHVQDNAGNVIDGQVRALNINWSRIIDYRVSKASGGIYTKEHIENGLTLDLEPGQQHYTNTLLLFPELILKNLDGDTHTINHQYVWVKYTAVQNNQNLKIESNNHSGLHRKILKFHFQAPPPPNRYPWIGGGAFSHSLISGLLSQSGRDLQVIRLSRK